MSLEDDYRFLFALEKPKSLAHMVSIGYLREESLERLRVLINLDKVFVHHYANRQPVYMMRTAYYKARKSATSEKVQSISAPVVQDLQWILNACESVGGHLVWQGAFSSGGTPMVSLPAEAPENGRPVRMKHKRSVQALVWELTTGRQVSNGYRVYRDCNCQGCVDFQHLAYRSIAENNKRSSILRARTKYPEIPVTTDLIFQT